MAKDFNKTTKKEEASDKVKEKIEAARNCLECNHTGWVVDLKYPNTPWTLGSAMLCICQRRLKLIMGEDITNLEFTY